MTFKHEYSLKTIFFESKQNIINLGFPKVVATIFYEKFGKHAPLIAKWFKEYYIVGKSKPTWWKETFRKGLFGSGTSSLYEMCNLYEASFLSEDEFNQAGKDMGLNIEISSPEDLQEFRTTIKGEIEDLLFQQVFFVSNVIKDIQSGKLTDLNPYRKLSFKDVKFSYDRTKTLELGKITKSYENGWKWVDAGKRCEYIGTTMKNCGSAGVMSGDPDRTILSLLDQNNKPRILVTYSPNDQIISGDEGVASTPVKEKYHQYVIDLADHLGAKFASDRSKSKALKVKYLLKNNLAHMETILTDLFDEIFFIRLKDGSEYYTNSFKALPKSVVDSSKEIVAKQYEYEIESPGHLVKLMFNTNFNFINKSYFVDLEDLKNNQVAEQNINFANIQTLLEFLSENEKTKEFYGSNFQYTMKQYSSEESGLAQYVVHFSDLPKWGINPSTVYYPVGVYFYYITDHCHNAVGNGFATDRSWANIAKINNDKMVILKQGHPRNFGESSYESSIGKIKQNFTDLPFDELSAEKKFDFVSKHNLSFSKLSSLLFSMEKQGFGSFNKLLKIAGYSGIVDYDGIFLPIEGCQGVITWPDGVTPVQSIPTPKKSPTATERLEKMLTRLKFQKSGTLKLTSNEIHQIIKMLPKFYYQIDSIESKSDLIGYLLMKLDFSENDALKWLETQDYFGDRFYMELEKNPTTPKKYWEMLSHSSDYGAKLTAQEMMSENKFHISNKYSVKQNNVANFTGIKTLLKFLIEVT